MECGWGSPEQIAACIHFAKRWFQVAVDVAGFGSLALITLLVWLFRRLRKDLAKWEQDAERERELRQFADSVATQAKHRAELAESVADLARKDLEELTERIQSGSDDHQKAIAEMHALLSTATARIDNALEVTKGGSNNFWARPVVNRFQGYEHGIASSIPILMFGNQKGGVGKSTLVSNLAAAFAQRGERVLTVDLDYQGSHSSLAQLQAGRGSEEPESLVDYLFQDELSADWPKLAIRRVTDSFHYIPAFYRFELEERRLEYQWALGEVADDVRYRLARALLGREVQDTYDRVLIDAPPRFTLGFVNGFCASTHLYVPTVVDLLSTSAVSAFARQFSELKPMVNPQIRWAGIIGTMTFPNRHNPMALTQRANDAATEAERAAQNRLQTHEPLFIRNPVITRDADLARATEKGIAYLNDSSVRPMFDSLASVIEVQAPSRRTRP